MKKFIQSRGFIITMLSLLCVMILGVCWYVNRDKDSGFSPAESPPATVSQAWTESTSETKKVTTKAETSAPQTSPAQETRTEEYPKVVETESDKEVVVEFTPTEKPVETQPPAPEGKTIMEDPGPEHPVNPAPEVTAPPTQAEAPSTPVPGSTNGEGAFYDPVFGWVEPGEVHQSTVDSDGDPNKMVGNMGD